MGRQGGDSDFSCRGGSTFCSRGGRVLKIFEKSPKMHFLREFWKFIQIFAILQF